MKEKLQNISEIHFGTAIKSFKNGKIPYLRVSNITDNGKIDTAQMSYVKDEAFESENLIELGDLLLPAKGQKFSSAIITDEFRNGVVASSSLFVIKITEGNVLPAYVHWYLNLPHTKWKLESAATGTNISSLSIKYLRGLIVELPDLETQQKIIDLKKLQEEEQKKMYQLVDARKKLTEAVTKKLIE